MKLLLWVGLFFLTACTQLPKAFEKERRGIRHSASHALYPRALGNYSFYLHDETQALQSEDDGGHHSTALYLDYKTGGPMTSILYRPFAKVETFQKPKRVKFDDFVKQELSKLTQNQEVLDDVVAQTKAGAKFRQVKLNTNQAFLSEGFSGVGFHEKLPAVTKYVFLDRGNHVIFMTTSYPANDVETMAKPNSEFVTKFLEAQK